MKEKATLNILYQSDSNMQYYMGVSIVSLFEHNKDAFINVYIIDIEIESCFLDVLESYIKERNGSVRIIDGNELAARPEVKEFPCYRGMRKNSRSYLKLFWSLAIHDDIDRLIYIDCDTAVVGKLSKLNSFDLDGKTIGMVYDSLITDEIVNVGLDKNEPYYNSGVILFDVKRWRASNACERIAEHAKTHSYGTVDQDLINIEFKNEIKCLPLEYNFQSIHYLTKPGLYVKEFNRSNYYSLREIEEASQNKKIVHYLKFNGENSWDKGNLHPCKKLFESYLRISPWKNLKKTKHKSKLIYFIEKILYIVLPRACFIKIFHIAHRGKINNSNK